MSDLFNELSIALADGDHERAEILQKKILLLSRDTTLDKNFIDKIKFKTLGKNLKKIVSGEDDFTNIEYAKILSSLITHFLIEQETAGVSAIDLGIHELYIALGNYLHGDEENAVNLTKEFIESHYSNFL